MELTQKYLGVDVGGNHIKMGFVDRTGKITGFTQHPTREFSESNNFHGKLKDAIAYKLLEIEGVTKIGIGLPGMITRDRNTLVEIPNIPNLNGLDLAPYLRENLPNKTIALENDANAAALGELLFAEPKAPDNFLFITMGTGIGSAAIIDRQIFKGADGNGLELGHIVSRNERRLEQIIGKQGIIDLATQMLAGWTEPTSLNREEAVSASKMVLAATEGDDFSKQVFYKVGERLGEGLVAAIRILDIKTIIIGGGLSNAYSALLPGIKSILLRYLTPYYLDKLVIRRASLGNDAGIQGAAALVMND